LINIASSFLNSPKVKTKSKAKNISSVPTAAKTSETKINDKTSPYAFN
jgi:hypothetical protein